MIDELLKINIVYDPILDRLVFSASDPPFERIVYLARGESWDGAIRLMQEAWQRWRNQ